VFHAGVSDVDGRLTLQADLLHRARTSLPLDDVRPGSTVHPLVLSGVLDAVAEHMLLVPELRGEESGATLATGPSVIAVFTAAAAAGQAIRVLTDAEDLDLLIADPWSRSSLEAALATGHIIVVPEAPVEIDGETVLGWWIIDPATGRTRDQLSNGMAGAATDVRGRPVMVLVDELEYTFLQRAVAWLAAHAKVFACLGYQAFILYLMSVAFQRAKDAAAAGNAEAALVHLLAGTVGGTGFAGAGAALLC
jgi:hypothetical protein